MDITKVNRNLSVLTWPEEQYQRGEYFQKQTIDLSLEKKDAIYKWFDPANNYPEHVINNIRKGTTLESILFEDLIYKTGAGFNVTDSGFQNYLDNDVVNAHNETFTTIFKQSNDHFNKLGNVFVELIFNEQIQLLSISVIQPQKNRLLRDNKNVWIFKDWTKFKKEDATKLPLYPNLKKFKNEGLIFYKSVFHIKNKVLGFDHYGINDKMIEALLLNEKEHRRNNWQLNQIKRGFKRDFFLVSEFPLTEKEKLKADEAFAKSSGDDYAGGVEAIEGENAKLVPAQSNYDFDYTKDDTSDQLFLKMGFPRSLIGIRQRTGTFSSEQIESDYDQYLPKIEEQQRFMIGEFTKIYNEHTPFNTLDWNVINNPPSIILQNYVDFMTEEQKNSVIEKVFKRYGIE